MRWSILPYEVGHSGSPPTRAGRDLRLVRGGASCRLGPGGPTHPKPRGPRDRARAAVPPPGPVVPVIGPVVPVKGSVRWSPLKELINKFLLEGEASRPPTTGLALTWVISLGGDIYRVGARQGATPPSTPIHEVDSGQGSSGPETYIYTSSRGPSPCHHPGLEVPVIGAQAGSTTRDTGACGHPASQVVGARPPRRAAAPPLLPDSLPSAAPPIHPSFVANWRMLGAYWDRRPEPPRAPPPEGKRPHPQGRTPWSPLPIGTHAHDEIPLAHRASRQRPIKAPGQGPGRLACRAMLGWTAWWPRSMQRRPLSGYRHTAASLRHWRLDASPPRPHAHVPRAVAPAMPSDPPHRPHPHPHRPSRTTPIQTHRPSRDSDRARKRSAVPTRFSGAHKRTQSGPPPAGRPAKSSAPLPCCQLARTGAAPPRGPGSTTPPSHSEARAGPPATRPSPPLPSNAANWQRAGHIGIAPPGTYPGTSKAAAPTTPPPSYPGPRSPGHGPRDIAADRLPPRPSVSPSAAKAHARSIQSTGEGSWTSRAGPRAPEMPVAAP